VLSVTTTFLPTEPAPSPDLLAQAQAGDPEAFCALCRCYEARLLRQAMCLCGDAALSEDLAQDTLVAAWKSLRRYNGRCQFFTWLCAILFHRYRNSIRAKRPFPFSILGSSDRDQTEHFLENIADAEMKPDEHFEQAERNHLLKQSVRKLSDKHREVIYLRFYVDNSLESIAAALDCSLGTVKSRLFHALEKLRAMEELNSTFGGGKETKS
jgi:RNA polymerase sigma-70 factor, ECF subfamily